MSLLGKLGRRFVPALILGAVIFLALTIYADWRSVVQAFRGFRWPYLIPALLLAFANYVVRFVRWEYYLRLLDMEVERRDSVVIFFSGLLMSVTPGKLGEVLKSYLLKKVAGIPISRSAPIVLAERFTDFLALVILSVLGVAVTGAGVVLMSVSLGIVVAILVLVSSRRLSLGAIRLLERIPPAAKHGDRLRMAYESTASLVAVRPLLLATPISVAAWFCECLAFLVVLRGFSVVSVGLGSATFIYALGTIAGALTMLPGGIGATEGVMTAMVIARGVLEPLAVSATFMVRACTLWFAVLVGMLFLIPHQRRFADLADEVLAGGQAVEATR